ncbi:flavin reductase family protein [Streptomyces sp. OfavH-34-F]|uniref:flavin reductase family protein n=1 Tax=Streptomyces sp. OfavH-34-F TaxID=2917760 RepID=UPI001EF1B729|nr:flavin reductase family protein [Streptomyces sp. OfavH-34-F]MCG7526863.1 flavin reductase family protein [Streptomyces sp. OfavH-34-F]
MIAFDRFTDALDYPMYVVTAEADGERAGCLVGFGSQCSMRPVRFMVWLSELNRTCRVASRAGRLAVHLLRRDQEELAHVFGGETGDRTDKFAQVAWRAGPGGVPVLEEAPAWFTGRVVERFPGHGDHVGFLLAPEEVHHPADGDFPFLPLSAAIGIPPGHPVD